MILWPPMANAAAALGRLRMQVPVCMSIKVFQTAVRAGRITVVMHRRCNELHDLPLRTVEGSSGVPQDDAWEFRTIVLLPSTCGASRKASRGCALTRFQQQSGNFAIGGHGCVRGAVPTLA